MTRKISKADKITAGNLREEASEIFDSCIQCGMCKAHCGVFRVLREEHFSPRGKGVLLSKKVLDKIFFECNLCRACEESCSLNVKVCDAVLNIREAMVLLDRGLEENEKMIKSIRKMGNPFEKGKDGDVKLYCC